MRDCAKFIFSGAVLMSALSVFPASAARIESFNQIWFDGSGIVVGQHAEYCNNVQIEGGRQAGVFSLVVHAGCGDQIATCSTSYSTDGTETLQCEGLGPNFALTATVAGNSGGLSVGELCDLTQACMEFEPQLMQGWGLDFHQVYP